MGPLGTPPFSIRGAIGSGSRSTCARSSRSKKPRQARIMNGNPGPPSQRRTQNARGPHADRGHLWPERTHGTVRQAVVELVSQRAQALSRRKLKLYENDGARSWRNDGPSCRLSRRSDDADSVGQILIPEICDRAATFSRENSELHQLQFSAGKIGDVQLVRKHHAAIAEDGQERLRYVYLEGLMLVLRALASGGHGQRHTNDRYDHTPQSYTEASIPGGVCQSGPFFRRRRLLAACPNHGTKRAGECLDG